MKINRIAYMVMRRFYYIPSMMHDIVSAENSKKYTFEEIADMTDLALYEVEKLKKQIDEGEI